MAYLLDVVYGIVLVAASPWLAINAVRKGKYRAGLGQKLLGLVPRRTSQAVVSLRMVRTRPGYIDGFADNLSLTISRRG